MLVKLIKESFLSPAHTHKVKSNTLCQKLRYCCNQQRASNSAILFAASASFLLIIRNNSQLLHFPTTKALSHQIYVQSPSSVTHTTTAMMNQKSSNDNNNDGNEISASKSIKDLQSQWAEGRDLWFSVPLTPSAGVASIQNRVREERDDCNNAESKIISWPEIVQKSILYGFGAYNPRGQTFPDDVKYLIMVVNSFLLVSNITCRCCSHYHR